MMDNCLPVPAMPPADAPDYPPGCVNTPPDYQRPGYLAWHDAAERRATRGETQAYCLRCERWRWSSTPCREEEHHD